MSEKTNSLVWMDLETTGLDPRETDPRTGYEAAVLEVAVVVTDDSSYETKLTRHWVIHHDNLDLRMLKPEVVEMHAHSGLFADLVHTHKNNAWARVARELDSLILDAWGEYEDGQYVPTKPLLCGNSVHFDRKWLEYHAPAAALNLHYRNLDVSSIYEMLLRSKMRDLAKEAKTSVVVGTPHRAMDDVLASIQLYQQLRLLCALDQ